MKSLPLILAASAILASTACNADTSDNATTATNVSGTTATPVPAPNNGDWTTVVSQTPEGGFVMGNPNAEVKLVEFGSMTCGHCATFDEEGAKPLIENYVKKGLVSYEFRNFVRDPYDITAAIVARCGGPSSFFGLTRALFDTQEEWIGKIQAADPAVMSALQSQPPEQQFKTVADIADFPAFAAMRGLPKAKTEACLTDPAAASRLVEMNSDAVSTYNVPGTPTFVINGEVVPNAADWSKLEPAIQAALAS